MDLASLHLAGDPLGYYNMQWMIHPPPCSGLSLQRYHQMLHCEDVCDMWYPSPQYQISASFLPAVQLQLCRWMHNRKPFEVIPGAKLLHSYSKEDYLHHMNNCNYEL